MKTIIVRHHAVTRHGKRFGEEHYKPVVDRLLKYYTTYKSILEADCMVGNSVRVKCGDMEMIVAVAEDILSIKTVLWAELDKAKTKTIRDDQGRRKAKKRLSRKEKRQGRLSYARY